MLAAGVFIESTLCSKVASLFSSLFDIRRKCGLLDGFPVLLALQDLVGAYRDSRSALNRPMGSRGQRLEARHFQPTVVGTTGPFMLGDFGKELPEDTHLLDLLDPEIPGLSTPPD